MATPAPCRGFMLSINFPSDAGRPAAVSLSTSYLTGDYWFTPAKGTSSIQSAPWSKIA